MRTVSQAVELLGVYNPENPLRLIELAGRTCYKSEGNMTEDSATDFVERVCLQKHHESVMEHSAATFRVICDRGVSHEFVRHRLASYSQESTRYCNYSKDRFGGEITVVEPPTLTSMGRAAWATAMQASETAYFELLKQGYPPQIARSVLPNSLKTELIVTMNFRSWRHFLYLRTAKAAHPQMREVAVKIGHMLFAAVPVLFQPWSPEFSGAES